jgi:polyphosphate glucokinase
MDVLGIDVGGSGIKAAMVNVETGELTTERLRHKTPQPSVPKAIIKTIRNLVREFDYSGPLGVGFPAIVLNGVVRSAANISDEWIGYSGQEKIARETGCEVSLLNDADAAGIAEMRFGAGRDQNGVVMILTLGTGIGSAVFVDGLLVPNTELGHLYLRGHQLDAEDYASERIRTIKGLKWKQWAGRLNEYFNHLELLFSPNLIILGGGISKKHAKFVPYLSLQTRVVPAELRNEAGIVGAAMGAVEKTRVDG